MRTVFVSLSCCFSTLRLHKIILARGEEFFQKATPPYCILGFGTGYTNETLYDITGTSDRVLTSKTSDELHTLVDNLVKSFCKSGESVSLARALGGAGAENATYP